eukprot:7484270-Pyramimonas_sp.AAC.1
MRKGCRASKDFRLSYLRERPVGTWVDEIPSWITLAQREGICKISMDQCTTGLRDFHGVLIRGPFEIMANRRLLLTPFESKLCTGHHQHASVCNKELAREAQCTPKMQSLF